MHNIAFKGLGISLNVKKTAFSLFGKDIYFYGLIIALAFVCGVIFASLRTKKRGIKADNILDIGIYGLISAVVCARLFYVIGDPGALDGGWWKIFAVWEGGISILGAIIGAIATVCIYCRIKKLSASDVFDTCVPAFMLGQAIGRWGNFFNAEVYGRETELLWGMSINGHPPVHPLFIYEIIWMLTGIALLLTYEKHQKKNGDFVWLYLIWYGIGRAWMEGMRDEQYILRLFSLPLSQIFAVILVIVGIAGLVWHYKRKPTEAVVEEISDEPEDISDDEMK